MQGPGFQTCAAIGGTFPRAGSAHPLHDGHDRHLLPIGRGCCARRAAPCDGRPWPINYADYLWRQNERDPRPTLADVYERSNLAAPGLRVDANAAAPDAAGGSRAANGASSAPAVADAMPPCHRLYGAPRIGDVTPLNAPMPVASHDGRPQPLVVTRGRLVDLLA